MSPVDDRHGVDVLVHEAAGLQVEHLGEAGCRWRCRGRSRAGRR